MTRVSKRANNSDMNTSKFNRLLNLFPLRSPFYTPLAVLAAGVHHSAWPVTVQSLSQAQHRGTCPRLGGSFATPWTVAHQASLSVGLPRQEYWSGLLFPSLEDLPKPGIKPVSPALAGEFYTTESPGKCHVSCSVQFSSVQSLSRIRLFARFLEICIFTYKSEKKRKMSKKYHIIRISLPNFFTECIIAIFPDTVIDT